MAVVKEFMLGNTKIQICDDYYAHKTEEERQRDKEIAIRNIENIGRRAYFKQCEKEPWQVVYKRWCGEDPPEVEDEE